MNDRFKFRVWDKRLKRYLCEYAPTPMLMSNGNLAYLDDAEMEFYEVEQCTGLKDKNGKLIYEGDIIQAINQDTVNKPDLQTGVIWGDELDCRWIKFKKEELSWNDFCSLIDYDCTLTIEVIGNIHENKELLND